MTAERGGADIPEWAREQRQQDMAWIAENMLILSTAANRAFQTGGRGVIVVDTMSVPVEGMGHPFAYYPQEAVEEADDEDIKRMVAAYEPEREMVIVLLKAEGRMSSYRVQAIQRVQRGRPRRAR